MMADLAAMGVVKDSQLSLEDRAEDGAEELPQEQREEWPANGEEDEPQDQELPEVPPAAGEQSVDAEKGNVGGEESVDAENAEKGKVGVEKRVLRRPAAADQPLRKRPAANKTAPTLDKLLVRLPLGGGPPEGDGLAEEAASNEVASKMFPPEMEDELWKAIEQQGFTVQPEVKMAKTIPPWGDVSAEGGIAEIRALPRPQFGRPQSLNLLIKPERVLKARKRALPKSGLVHKPMRIRRFGTLRCYSATFQRSTALGKRGCRDMGNIIYYSTKYKATMKRKRTLQRKVCCSQAGGVDDGPACQLDLEPTHSRCRPGTTRPGEMCQHLAILRRGRN